MTDGLADVLDGREIDLLSDLLLWYEVRQFYNREAICLDEARLDDWLELVTDDVRYDMPVRVTREKMAERSEFSEAAFNYRENKSTLEARVDRFHTEFAWSEEPPSRQRHYVTNLHVGEPDGDEIPVRANLLLYRGQEEDVEGVFLSGERHDVLRRVDGDLKLAERDVRLDHTILPMKNISVFF